MVKHIAITDFRAVRFVFEADDFALVSGPERAPSDLVSEDTWKSLIAITDDVAIRTSNHHGQVLKNLYDLWGAWVNILGDADDIIDHTSFVASDEFSAVTFNALHGYYRQAIGGLRNALELTTIGTYCQVCSKRAEFDQWLEGKIEMKFGAACDGLHSASAVQPINTQLQASLQDSIFAQKTKTSNGGWVRRLHSGLSDYMHSRPGHTNFDLWASNGPIYEPNSFKLTARLYLETSALCFLLVKIATPSLKLPTEAEWLFHSRKSPFDWDAIAIESYGVLFAGKTV